MGFGNQIQEIVNRLPESRQTLLFSATLPKILVDFAKAGLSDPVLLRLDIDSKLPEGLSLSFITCRPEEKLAVLLCLLKRIIKSDSKIIIFAETMHHVEYLHQVIIYIYNYLLNIFCNINYVIRSIIWMQNDLYRYWIKQVFPILSSIRISILPHVK